MANFFRISCAVVGTRYLSIVGTIPGDDSNNVDFGFATMPSLACDNCNIVLEPRDGRTSNPVFAFTGGIKCTGAIPDSKSGTTMPTCRPAPPIAKDTNILVNFTTGQKDTWKDYELDILPQTPLALFIGLDYVSADLDSNIGRSDVFVTIGAGAEE